MSLSLQKQLVTLLDWRSNASFLDLRIVSNFNEVVEMTNAAFVTFAIKLTQIFLLSDFILYVGIVAIILVLGSRLRSFNNSLLTRLLVNVSGLFIYISLLLNIFGLSLGFNFIATHNLVVFDAAYTISFYSQLAKLAIALISLILYSLFSSIQGTKMRAIELPLLMHVSIALSSTIISSTNFVLLLLALEGFSLILYIMTTLSRQYGGVMAAVKYFAFGTLGSIFLLWGTVHIYAIVPSLTFEVIKIMSYQAYFESTSFISALSFAATAIIFGFMLKLGAAPAHQWVADVYAGSHIYITAFFSTLVKFVLFMAFFRSSVYFNSDSLLKLFILASLVAGCVMSVRQTEIKRLVAYSSIVHVAFLLMGDSISSLMYLLTYIIASLLLFSVLLSIEVAGKEVIYLSDLQFTRGSNDFQVICLVLALASSAGLPPFAGFYGKLLVWSSLIEDIYLFNDIYSYLALFLSIGVSLITIYYYMRILAYLFIGDSGHLCAPYYCPSRTSLASFSINNLLTSQLVLAIFATAWTFLQAYFLGIIQYIVLSNWI